MGLNSKKLRLSFGGNTVVDLFIPRVARRLGGDLDASIASLGDVQPCMTAV